MAARRTAVVTGASSGIGEATVRCLAREGFDVIAGARRTDRLDALAAETGATARRLDVTDPASVDEFCAGIESLNVLVNNAGGALGLEPLADLDEASWRAMWETNVLGLARMTKALLPALERSGDSHIVNVGSVAGIEAYPGGSGYNAAKFGVRAITQALRKELLGRPIRVTEVAPGLVDTEFSIVRFGGDAERAKTVYEGCTPLTAVDVGECITFAVTRPSHVNVDYLLVMPRDQASATLVHRRKS